MAAPLISTSVSLPIISWSQLQVGEQIGQGGYGEVFRGQWNGKDIAIKQLYLKTLPEHLIKDFENETKIMAQCNSCLQIIKLLGVCKEQNHYAMVLEYMEKGSLDQILLNEEIELHWQTLRLKIAIDIGKGLSYLHDREILHRDLKSLNILLDRNFNAKITDFGLSRIKLQTNTSTLNKQSAGTVRWKAPELFQRGIQHSKASDVYSYGMILWEIASRKIPFSDATDDVTAMGWIKEGQQESFPSDTPPEYSKLVSRSWIKEPDKRPSAQYIVLELEKLKPKPTAKSWHFDPETKVLGEGIGADYALIDATTSDIEKVKRFYMHHPVPGHEIKSVKIVYNPSLQRRFSEHMKLLQNRKGNPFFDPKWQMNLLDDTQDWRQKVAEMFEKMAQPYSDPDYPNVKLLPLWHGTSLGAVDSICKVGYANPTATDVGFFGRGLYGAHEAAYPYRVYYKGAFFLNWVAIFSAYPVVIGDEDKLKAKGNFENYDAHFIPVSPRDPTNPNEANYDPCSPFTPPTYSEIVIFESAACLPRYLVTLQPSSTQPQDLWTKAPLSSEHPTVQSSPTTRQRKHATGASFPSLGQARISKEGSSLLTPHTSTAPSLLPLPPPPLSVSPSAKPLQTPILLTSSSLPSSVIKTLAGHTYPVNSLIFLSNGNLASAAHDGVKIWNPTSGAILHILKQKEIGDRTITTDTGGVICEDVNGRLITNYIINKFHGNTFSLSLPSDELNISISLWNYKDGKLMKRIDVYQVHAREALPDLFSNGYPVSGTDKQIEMIAKVNLCALSTSSDGTIACGGSPKNIIHWIDPRGNITKIKGHAGRVRVLRFLKSDILASGSEDNTIKLWDSQKKLINTLQGHTQAVCALIALSDGSLASSDGKTIIFWDISTGKLLQTLNLGAKAFALLKDGTLVSAGDSIKMWNPKTGALLKTLDSPANALTILNDGTLVSAYDKNIQFWQ